MCIKDYEKTTFHQKLFICSYIFLFLLVSSDAISIKIKKAKTLKHLEKLFIIGIKLT